MGDLEIPADYDFLEECIIFGFHVRGESFEVIILCILNAKYYIHNKRLLDDNNIEFLHFLYVLKFKLDITIKNQLPRYVTNLYSYMTKCDTNIYVS